LVTVRKGRLWQYMAVRDNQLICFGHKNEVFV